MDSMTEELARAVFERADNATKIVESACDGKPYSDRLSYWRQIRSHSKSILETIRDYRKDHPEEYEDTSLARALQREKDLQEQVVSLRKELRIYREREKTMGWNQN
jgi:hypothetical protein